jgi:hypothetical protein
MLALNHQEADRVPIDLGFDIVAAFETALEYGRYR